MYASWKNNKGLYVVLCAGCVRLWSRACVRVSSAIALTFYVQAVQIALL